MAEDYSGVKKMLGDMLEKKRADKANEDSIRQAKNDSDRNKILENVSGDLAKSLQPVLADLAKNSKLSTDDIRQALAEAIQINLPEIKIPDMPAPVVHVPAPIVHVAAPVIPAPVVSVSPSEVNFPSEMSLKAGNRPFPVIMMDAANKPMQFPQMSMGASGGRADFFAIRDIQTSAGASIIDQVDGALKVVGSFSVSASNSSTQAIDSSGNPYSAANPFPTTATISLPAGPGDAATATRILQAGDSVSSVIVNSGTITTVTAVTGITNSIAASMVDSTGVQYSGSNPVPITGTITGVTNTLAVMEVDSTGVGYSGSNPFPISGTVLVSDISASLKAALTDSSGVQYSGSNPVPITGSITTVTTVTSVTNSIAAAIVDSTGVEYSGSNPVPITGNIGTVTTVTGITNTIAAAVVDSTGIEYSGSNPMPVTVVSGASTSTLAVGDSAQRAADNGGNPVKIGGIARSTFPTLHADADRASFTTDKFGRQLVRPIQVRDLVTTAYVSLTTGTEATFLAASAGQTFDLIWVMLSNQSTAAVQVDVRPVLAGNIAMTFQVPANGTVGVAPPVPLPGSGDTGNAWTVDMPDITGTTVNITGLFSREI